MPLHFSQDPLPPSNLGECHIAAVLAVDTSGSMAGIPIDELNKGLAAFGEALQKDSLACGRAEVCIISFNSSVQTEMSFRPATEYEAPTLSASGLTSMNEAIECALDALEVRKQTYKDNGVSYYRPWLFLLTDGAPTDEEKENAARIRLQNAIRNKKVVYMPMGIGSNADLKKLKSYYPDEATARPTLQANSKDFMEAFVWLSSSISEISHSDPRTTSEVQLPPTPSNLVVGI